MYVIRIHWVTDFISGLELDKKKYIACAWCLSSFGYGAVVMRLFWGAIFMLYRDGQIFEFLLALLKGRDRYWLFVFGKEIHND